MRTWGSLTPGHPEYGHTHGVETTTGPLGQGLANAVGMAMAARRERGLFDPDAEPGQSVFDHQIYVIASDGDIEEGVTSEASSLAGTQQLGNLTVIYDSNEISIEDDTRIALSEDTAKRYEAYGWHVHRRGRRERRRVPRCARARRAETARPSLIVLRTVIGYPAPTKMNTGKAHGAALGADELAAVKRVLGFDPDADFHVDDEVLRTPARWPSAAGPTTRSGSTSSMPGQPANPERKALLDRLRPRAARRLGRACPRWEPDAKGVATRKASGAVLGRSARCCPSCGAGRPTWPRATTPRSRAPTLRPDRDLHQDWTPTPTAAPCTSASASTRWARSSTASRCTGRTRPYGGTFLVFSDYMRPAVRLAALMRLPAIYVWTHDSIGLGEDGPTHQPVEHLASLRAIPGLRWSARPTRTRPRTPGRPCWRTRRPGRAGAHPAEPADAGGHLRRGGRPRRLRARRGVRRRPEVVLVGTGSEVQLAVDGQEDPRGRRRRHPGGVDAVRGVVRPAGPVLPRQVLPAAVRARVVVEAGIAQPWHRFAGDAGEIVSLEHFGASADFKTLYREFGITTEAVVAAAKRSVANIS